MPCIHCANIKLPQTVMDILTTAQGFSTGKPKTFQFLKNTEKAPKIKSIYGNSQNFGQDIEPVGFYCLYTNGTHLLSPKWYLGTATVQSPLVVDLGLGSVSYKKILSEALNAKGKNLTQKLLKLGYDAIVTVDMNDPMEIILFKPRSQIDDQETDHKTQNKQK